MAASYASSSSSDMTTPPPSVSSDSQSTDVNQPEEPPRVYDLYSWSDKAAPGTRLVYIQNEATANIALSKLNAKVLGFDLEWRPNFVKGYPENPVALVQLASEDTILLIHLSFMSNFPEKLKELLADPTVVKAGVGIQKDCKKLFYDHNVDTRNCVDLSLLARTVDNQRWKGKYSNPIGLARLCEAYEELTLQKGKIQTSNWERPLDIRQQEYAANDCHVGFVLYKRLIAMTTTMTPVPHRVWFSFDTLSGSFYQPSSAVVWHPFNPYYDPGPPPPPRPPRVFEGDHVDQDGFPRPFKGSRYPRNNRMRPQRPLSPIASSFVPGVKEHSPSPSPSPILGYAASSRATPPPPSRSSDVRVAPTGFSVDMDGFPRLPRASRPWQPQPVKPRAFRGDVPGAVPIHTQPGRGRGRGRGYAPIAVAPTG